jgi:glycosyltransferase involved in cell wall biosynthesis
MPIHVLVFDDRHDRIYGSQRTLVEHSVNLAAHQDVVPFFGSCREGMLLDSAKAEGLQTLVIPVRSEFLVYGKQLLTGSLRLRLSGILGLLRSSWTFRRSCRTYGINVVVAASIRPLLLAIPARLLGDTKVIWYAQNAEFFRLASVAGRLVADRIAIVAPESDVAWRGRAVSAEQRTLLGVTLVPVPRACKIVRNSMRLMDDDKIRLVTVGSLIARKGIDRAVHVANTVASVSQRIVTLTVVGDCPHEGARAHEVELRALAQSGAARVDFVGWQNNVTPFIEGAHALLFLSRSDAWGRVVSEALTQGVPVMGCEDLGAVNALINDGVNGWVVPQSDLLEQAATRVAADLIDGVRMIEMSESAAATTEIVDEDGVEDPSTLLVNLIRQTTDSVKLRSVLMTRLRRFR